MPWSHKQPDLTNNPLYLEPRVTATETQLAQITYHLDGFSGATDTEKMDNLLATAQAGSNVVLTKGKTYTFTKAFVFKKGMKLYGNQATVNFDCAASTQCFVLNDDCGIYDLAVNQIGDSTAGSDNGDVRCPIKIGDYASGVGYSNIEVKRLTITGNRDNGNLIIVTGDSQNITIEDIYFPSSAVSGRPILLHWGGFAQPTTTHPSNITIKNVIMDGAKNPAVGNSAGVFISACHNVTLKNILIKDCTNGIFIYPGDRGYNNASASDKKMAMKNILVENLNVLNATNYGVLVTTIEYTGVSKFAYDVFVSIKNSSLFGNNTNSVSGITVENAKFVDIENCKVDGFINGITLNKGAQKVSIVKSNISTLITSASIGIHVFEVSHIFIDSCTVEGFENNIKADASGANSNFNLNIKKSEIIGVATTINGIYLNAIGMVTINESSIRNAQNGINAISYVQQTSLKGCRINNNSAYGVVIGSGESSKIISLEECWIYANANGIKVHNVTNARISDSLFGLPTETIQDYSIQVTSTTATLSIISNFVQSSKLNNTFDLGGNANNPSYYKIEGNTYFASAVVPVLNYMPVTRSSHGNVVEYSTAIPVLTNKPYKVGDIIWNRNAAAGGKAGWICITAGSPGTWKGFGVIDA